MPIGTLRGVNPLTRRKGHLIVCGDNPLALRLIEELKGRYRQDVVVILPSKKRNYGPQIVATKVKVVEAERLDAATFRAAGVTDARAVAFVDQDDVGNVHAALRVHEIRYDIRMVVRIFNTNLGHRLRELFTDVAFLSDASLAAPSFVAAALGDVTPSHARLPGRTVYVAKRSDVAEEHVVCGLGGGDSDGGVVLPGDSDSELVLATADAKSLRRGRFRRLPHTAIWHWVRGVFSRKLRIAAIVVAGVLIAGSLLYGLTRDDLDHWYDSVYFVLLTAAGGADPDEALPALAKIIQTVVMLSGIALVPLVTAAVVDGMVGARLAVTVGRLRDSTRSHVIVVGLGNVGSRVVMQLHDLGLPVVAVDRETSATGVRIANERKIPVILGDATQAETLRAAKVEACRALVAVTSDDVKNLEAALHARSMVADLRIVLRLFDADLAARIQKDFDIALSRSVSTLAAQNFALAMVERKVFDAIPVDSRVLLFGDFPVGVGSPLEGKPLSAAQVPGRARVIALGGTGNRYDWSPDTDHVLGTRDRLIVLATRGGVARMAELTEAPVDEPS